MFRFAVRCCSSVSAMQSLMRHVAAQDVGVVLRGEGGSPRPKLQTSASACAAKPVREHAGGDRERRSGEGCGRHQEVRHDDEHGTAQEALDGMRLARVQTRLTRVRCDVQGRCCVNRVRAVDGEGLPLRVELSRNHFTQHRRPSCPTPMLLTSRARLRLAKLIVEDDWPVAVAAKMFMTSQPTARKWATRFRVEGPAGMVDIQSAPVD